MRTKAQILIAKRDAIAAELHKANREIEGLKGTDCNLTCGGCGAVHATEWDFASHYTIPDERYLNLGSCPHGQTYTPARVSVHFKFSTRIGKG